MILPNLLLQKPSAKSKSKDHSKLLENRIKLWDEGNIQAILDEATTIQNKLYSSRKTRSNEDIVRIFSNLIFEGKLGSALKFLDEQSENAVLPPTEKVIAKMRELYPEASEI